MTKKAAVLFAKSKAMPEIFQKKLAAKIKIELQDFDRRLLEQSGTAVFVVNRHVRQFDEWILLDLLAAHCSKFSLLHPHILPIEKGLRQHVFGKIDFQNLDSDALARKIAATVERGESVGLVLDFSENLLVQIEQELVQRRVLRALKKSGVRVVPLHFSSDAPRGGVFGQIFPIQNFIKSSQPLEVRVRVGRAILPSEAAVFPKTGEWIRFLQAKIFSLASPIAEPSDDFFSKIGSRFRSEFRGEKNEGKTAAPLAPPVPQTDIESDIAALRPEQKLATRGQFEIYVAPFQALPNVMFEIGRLRELTFRTVGEGTGKPRDLDAYDIYYQQLIIWDAEKRQLVGGYRIGEGDKIFRRFGLNGFYISSLFKIKKGFVPVLQQSVELGRSYIVPEYQKHRLPLFLLWKGILFFLLANPRFRFIHGPVSISKYYSEVSKSVIVEFVEKYFFDWELAKLVRPRKPFRFRNRDVDARLLVEALGSQFENLDDFVATIEPEHFRMPVLFKQYLKQNAKFIAFNVDPSFSDCLDGLMILDIRDLPKSTIEALQQEK